MGYTILMQWTVAALPSGTSISDLVLGRVLEHYNITQPLRSTIECRTFKTSFPPQTAISSPTTRILTTITYSHPITSLMRNVPLGARDDVTYLFLEDRGVPPKRPKDASKNLKAPISLNGSAKEPPTAPKEAKKGDTKEGEAMDIDPTDKAKEATTGEKDAGKDAGKESVPTIPSTTPLPPKREKERYKILALKPATSVIPLLTSLGSPFVLGKSKAARGSTNASSAPAQPTALAGVRLALTTLAFPPTSYPHPALSLSVHVLTNNAANSIFLECEWDGGDSGTEILKEFLRGCVPDVAGEVKFFEWDGGDGGEAMGWSGVEKTRRTTKLLAQALTEGGFFYSRVLDG